jgi:hypothetical protein
MGLLALFPFATLCGCATDRLVSRAGSELVEHAVATYRDEPDFEIARVSAYANIKLMEALHHADPEDEETVLRLAEGFAGIAFAFAEDDLQRSGAAGGEVEAARDRVVALYLRGRSYAERALSASRPELAAALHDSAFSLRRTLDTATAGDVRPLFWYAFNALGAAGADADPATRAPELGRIRVVAERLTELDGAFEHGGPWLLLGVIDASLPEHLSVTADGGEAAFEKARLASAGRFLLTDVEWARAHAVTTGDRAGFTNALEEVLAAPDDVLPGERLMTVVAKRRARRLLQQSDSLFAPVETDDGE